MAEARRAQAWRERANNLRAGSAVTMGPRRQMVERGPRPEACRTQLPGNERPQLGAPGKDADPWGIQISQCWNRRGRVGRRGVRGSPAEPRSWGGSLQKTGAGEGGLDPGSRVSRPSRGETVQVEAAGTGSGVSGRQEVALEHIQVLLENRENASRLHASPGATLREHRALPPRPSPLADRGHGRHCRHAGHQPAKGPSGPRADHGPREGWRTV